MTPEDRRAFVEIVVGFAELKGKQLSAPALELFWRSMQHWQMADFRSAANHLIRTCEFMPTPKDFEDVRRASLVTPVEAWSKVLEHTSSGEYRHGSLDDLSERVIRALGGYQAVATCELAKLPFMERRFCEHYETMRESDEARGVPQLCRDNPLSLLQLQRPKAIGSG